MQKTTLADIAKALGVSKTLVSLVLNGRGDEHGISADTPKRVLIKAKELNYRPNPIARGLRTGKSHTIGLIVTDISNIFMAKIARAIEDKVRKFGYHLIFCSSDEDTERENALIQMMQERQADGLIIMSAAKEPERIQELLKEDYPFVLIDRFLEDTKTNYVGVDNFESSKQAVLHLLDQGYENVAFLGITPKHLSPIVDRERGYLEALKIRNIKLNKKLACDIPFDNIKSAVYKELNELCFPEKKIDAIFAANNSIAIACLQFFKEKGLQLPTDVALISYDDIDLFSFTNPPVSAVAQPIQDIGEKAVDLLMQYINAKSSKGLELEHHEIKGQLIIRESTMK